MSQPNSSNTSSGTPKASTKKTESVLKDRRTRVSYLLLTNILIVAFLAGAYFIFSSRSQSTPYLLTESSQQIPVEIVDSVAERMKGLSGREGIDGGLFFIFDRVDRHGIWMKDMKFAIDIVWIDADKRIVTIEKNVSPDTYPKTFYPDEPSLYVLELTAGEASRYQLSENQSLRFNW